MHEPVANSEDIRAQLRGVLAHSSFRESERHRRLLEFLVESTLSGNSDGLKEFVIAAEVWGRDVSFDPRFHSTVRVEVSRLRARLERYYGGEGATDRIRFRIPVGGYVVVFEDQAEGSLPSAAGVEHFEILEVLGRGGMGEIRRARDTRLNRFVALKFIPETLPQDQATVERFAAEAQAAASINHPNICTVYETGFIQGRPFFAMELLEGQTLRHKLQDGAIPLDSFLNWAIQITDGMDAAHTSGIIHRDLKPANLFITARDQAKILDFGLAKLRSMIPQAPADGEEATGVTTISGTLGYMSPEQTRGETLDSRTDLFALGTVFYEMLTGHAAFGHSSALDVHRAVLAENPEPPSRLNHSIPPELDRIVLKALEKDRDLRYQNAADLRADLKRLKRDSDSQNSLPAAIAPVQPVVQTVAKKRWWLAACIAGFLVLASGGLFLWQRSRVPKFAGNGNVVLAQFANSTGEAVFDTTLREGLAAQLQQSPYLGVVSDARIAQTMKLMMQPKDAALTPALAREVCQRTGSAASIEGSIASIGSQYVVGVRALDCKSGDILAQVQESASGKEEVLKALGLAASQLRSKLGESLPSQQKYDAPPANVSTGSLDALEAYGLGVKAQSEGDCSSAAIQYKRAIALDPNFAMAYGRLGICVGAGPEGEGYYRKAYELRDRVSEREKFYLASHYEQYVRGDLEAARKQLEAWTQTYPHDGDAPPNLLKLYLTTGEVDKAWPLVQRLVKESPGTPANNATRMSTTLLFLNRIDEAKAILGDVVAHHIDTPVQHFYLYEIGFMQHDEAAMDREVAYLRAQPEWLSNILDLESFSAAFTGQFEKARVLNQQAVEHLKHEGDAAGAASFLAEEGMEEALAGNRVLAKEKARMALALSDGKDSTQSAGLALALAGDAAGAARVAGDLNRRFPADTFIQVSVAIMRACSSLGDGKSPEGAKKAIEGMAEISRYDLSAILYLLPMHVRGRAYLAAGEPAKAAAEFQRMLDHSGVTRNYITGATARLGLADAEAQAGDKPKARADYAAFLALWKDADADEPLLKAAKASLAELSH